MKHGIKNRLLFFSSSDEKELILCGDGCCNSLGHNAKYLTDSLYDQIQKQVVAISLTQVMDVGSSNRMEKAGLIKTLQEVKGKEHQNQTFDNRLSPSGQEICM